MPFSLTRLYPPDGQGQPLEGLCLAHHLLDHAQPDTPYIYSSFIMSLNGAIAVDDGADEWSHPRTLTDPRDLRLLCELMAQADCLITSGSYLRDLERGSLGNLLQLPKESEYQDLHDYRARHHASPYPSVLVVSRSLDFDVPASIAEHHQTLRVLTPKDAPAERIKALESQNIEVIVTDDTDWVGHDAVLHHLKDLKARTAYLFCGPQMNGLLLQAQQLDRLYMTWLHRLHGGHPALTAGAFLPADTSFDLTMGELFWAPAQQDLPGLWLGYFEP